MNKLVIGLLILPLCQVALGAGYRTASVFRDKMLLQRDRKVAIWGEAPTGTKVVVRFDKQTKSITAADDKWKLHLDAMKANSKGQDLTAKFYAGKKLEHTIVLRDVLIGDVYLAGGQSNMFSLLRGYLRRSGEKAVDNPLIRIYDFPSLKEYGQQPDRWPNEWVKCGNNPGTLKSSSTAYYFATKLQAEIGVPVGIIKCAVGSTPIEAWMSKQALMGDPDLRPVMKRKNDPEIRDFKEPTILYDQMIAPLLPFTLCGVIWYQGESNTGNRPHVGPLHYGKLFRTLIKQWRADFENPELPFFFVQLASFGGHKEGDDTYGNNDNWAYLREGQASALDLKNTGMVCAIDLGEKNNIHPATKPEVGRRLSLLARKHIYGEKLEASGPLYRSHSIEKDKIVVAFNHTAGGLKLSKGTRLVGFELASTDKKFVPAVAVVRGDSVEVSGIQNPKYVRYAWKNWPEYDGAMPNLYNKADLPASPFRTDTFKPKNTSRRRN